MFICLSYSCSIWWNEEITVKFTSRRCLYTLLKKRTITSNRRRRRHDDVRAGVTFHKSTKVTHLTKMAVAAATAHAVFYYFGIGCVCVGFPAQSSTTTSTRLSRLSCQQSRRYRSMRAWRGQTDECRDWSETEARSFATLTSRSQFSIPSPSPLSPT